MTIEQRDSTFAYVFQKNGFPIRTEEDAARLVPEQWPEYCRRTYPKWFPSPDFKDREKTAAEKVMTKRLLSFTGTRVVIPQWGEEDVDAILTRGQLWLGDKVKKQKGAPNQCHSNSAGLWKANTGRKLENSFRMELALATGYALSADGFWRQHSWCVLRTPRACRVVETTEKRLLYFGYIMTEEESEEFFFNNPCY